MQIADTVTVLRDGRTIGTKPVATITKNDIISMMVGRELTSLFPREPHTRGDLVLEVEGFSVQDPDIPSRQLVRNVSFKAYRGEILGVAGLMGAGRTELFSSIFGTFPAGRSGTVRIDGDIVNIENSYDAMQHGIFLVTEDRKRYGLVLGMDVKENTTLASLKTVSRMGLLDQSAEIHETGALVTRLNTKTPSVEVQVKTLSGGNQQKVVLQKALLTRPKVLILDEPTRGIDVGAKYEIYKIMNQLVDDGVVIIMISSEMEEILGMSDRIIVLSEGELTGEYTIADATQEKIMHASIGGKK
jgi:D-xylose transport system ATP-binding protein